MLFKSKWMELELILLTNERQAQKGKGHMFSLCVETKPKR
jgi:hypothetical protein